MTIKTITSVGTAGTIEYGFWDPSKPEQGFYFHASIVPALDATDVGYIQTIRREPLDAPELEPEVDDKSNWRAERTIIDGKDRGGWAVDVGVDQLGPFYGRRRDGLVHKMMPSVMPDGTTHMCTLGQNDRKRAEAAEMWDVPDRVLLGTRLVFMTTLYSVHGDEYLTIFWGFNYESSGASPIEPVVLIPGSKTPLVNGLIDDELLADQHAAFDAWNLFTETEELRGRFDKIKSRKKK
jgi:hypothetical protein